MAIHNRILFVVEAMGGGVFTYIVDLANELVKNNDVYIAYSVRPQTPKNYKENFDKRINLIRVKNFTRNINPLKDIKAAIEIKKIAKRVQPDVIHLHSSKAGVIGRIVLKNSGIPLFYTPHGYSFLMENYKPARRYFYKIIEKICAKCNCTTISCSLGEHYETIKLTKNANYVNNGINISDLDKVIETVDVVEHPYTVFTLGRICYQKNPRLFNSIAEAMPNIKFLWIGDGELRDELKSSNIEITGWIDRKVALRKSMNADVFILTSLWEGLPISLLESMYMRKLCVVNDVIGNHDVIKNGKNGFVCKTVEEYVTSIKTEAKDNLIENAYNDIIKKYNTKTMCYHYEEIYNEKIHGKT